MTAPLTRLNQLHIAAVGLWAGSLAMSGVAAALIFPGMKRLSPTLPEYAQYTGDHWMIAAGMIAARQFAVLAWVEAALALVAVGSLLLLVASGRTRLSLMLVLRILGIGAVTAILVFQAFFLQPRMDRHMHAHWDAARQGDNEAAVASKNAFTADHPLASGLMQARLGLLLACLLAGVWSVRANASPARTSGTDGLPA